MNLDQAFQNLAAAAEQANASGKLSLAQAHAVVCSLEIVSSALRELQTLKGQTQPSSPAVVAEA